MLFAIRDDDTSFWTDPHELERVYREVWEKGIPVSLAVIPFSVPSYGRGSWDTFYQGENQRAIGENALLVDFLKEKVKEGKISIMLHGYSHQYKVANKWRAMPLLATKDHLDILRKNIRGKDLVWYGEYHWKSFTQMKYETKTGKEYLEDIFHTRINIFVPPSNDISAEGSKAVSECGMHMSGTIQISRFNRPLTLHSVRNWVIRVWWRLMHRKVYPFVLNYGKNKELCAYGYVPSVPFEALMSQMEYCAREKAPFVLATHHWEIAADQDFYGLLGELSNIAHHEIIYTVLDELFV